VAVVNTDADRLIGQATGQGAFAVIDEAKLGLVGIRILGGIEALMEAITVLNRIRDRSTDLKERVFLKEVGELLMQGVDAKQAQLAEYAVQRGAGQIVDVEPEAKPS
jgi:hypothetical protein